MALRIYWNVGEVGTEKGIAFQFPGFQRLRHDHVADKQLLRFWLGISTFFEPYASWFHVLRWRAVFMLRSSLLPIDTPGSRHSFCLRLST